MSRSGIAEYEAFVALARLCSFRAAANELGVAPSALSTAIAGLEARLGVRLFNRTTRSVALTEAGAAFLARVQPALIQIDAAVEAINGLRETPMGVLRLNTNGLAVGQIMPIVAEYLRLYPRMQVDIATDSQFVDIVAGGFDAGVRLAGDVPKDMISVQIVPQERHLVVAAPGYFAERSRPVVPRDLLAHRCILGRIGQRRMTRWEFARAGEAVAVDVDGPLVLDQPIAMREAALAGVGLAWLHESLVAEALDGGQLVSVLDDWVETYPGISIYYPGRRHVPAGLRAFLDLVRQWRHEAAAGLSRPLAERRGRDRPGP